MAEKSPGKSVGEQFREAIESGGRDEPGAAGCGCPVCTGQVKPGGPTPTTVLTGSGPYLAAAGELYVALPDVPEPTVVGVGYEPTTRTWVLKLSLHPTRRQRVVWWALRVVARVVKRIR